MAPVIGHNDVENVRNIGRTSPPRDFPIIDPHSQGLAWMSKQPPLKLIHINQLCKRNSAGIQLALPKNIADAKKQLKALREHLEIARDDLIKKTIEIPG